MPQIDFKLGIKLACVAMMILVVEISIYFALGVASQAAAGKGVVFFFNSLLFVIIVTLSFSALSFVFGLLSKFNFFNFCISFSQLLLISIFAGGVVFFLMLIFNS